MNFDENLQSGTLTSLSIFFIHPANLGYPPSFNPILHIIFLHVNISTYCIVNEVSR